MRGSVAAYSRQIDSVASVEALSEMISSKSVKVCARSDSTAARIDSSPLYTGRPMLTAGTWRFVGNSVWLTVVCASSIQGVTSERFELAPQKYPRGRHGPQNQRRRRQGDARQGTGQRHAIVRQGDPVAHHQRSEERRVGKEC